MQAAPGAPLQTEVLVVGAGPVGLSLAIELGRRGVDTLVVEQNARVGYQPRAKLTNVRSMEHMRRWGIAGKMRSASPLPPDLPTSVIFATRLFGYPLAFFENAFFGSQERNELFSEPAQWIPQYCVEAVLRDHAATLPTVDLRFSTRLESATQSADAVVAEITDLVSRERRAVRAAFLIGADGARSLVRQLIGARMEGSHAFAQNFNVILRAPGLGKIHPQARGIMYWLLNADCPAIMHPLDRDDTWVLSLQGTDGRTEMDESDIRFRLAKAVGRQVDCEILHCDSWAAHRLIADRYRAGRILLAGDACHLHPPAGGYGMNMGIGDAVDLGWKLTATLHGWGGPSLLSAYESERRPVHARVIGEATQNYSVLATDLVRDNLEQEGSAGDEARRALGAEILATKVREFKTLGVVLGYHYSGSPLVVPDGSAPPTEHFMHYEPSAHPGCLAPHLWLSENESLYDRFGDGFTLLQTRPGGRGDAERAASAAAARNMTMTVCAPGDPRLPDLYGARYALIRPDQHVAWRGDRIPDDVESLLDRVSGGQPAVDDPLCAGR